MGFAGVLAVFVVAGAIVLVVKGWDVRLVLLAAALVIATAAGDVPLVLREFLATFSNEKFVVPICTAMGFAYVLKHTGCERHLVLLLMKPLKRARGLLVPGVVAVGFLVNIPLVSQTSTAVCLGAVVVPLMRAAGYSMATIGACLLLGASVGGELLNPGAPELLTVENRTGVPSVVQARDYLPPLVFTQLAVATCVLWLMSVWWERGAKKEVASAPAPERASAVGAAVTGETPPERINVVKAFVPLVPLVLLFASAPPFNFVTIPETWVALRPPNPADNTWRAGLSIAAGVRAAGDGVRAQTPAEERELRNLAGRPDPAYSSRLIGLAMMIGVLVAAVVTPNKARDCVKEFFAGAGYGFANIVSLIVIATCFGKAIEAAGLARALARSSNRCRT